MGRKSYEFHRDGSVVWSLVFEPVSGLWHIQKAEHGGARVRLTLDEFENSEHGRRLRGALAGALREAEDDA